MVVLTFLLAKAAYDRFNSPREGEGVDGGDDHAVGESTGTISLDHCNRVGREHLIQLPAPPLRKSSSLSSRPLQRVPINRSLSSSQSRSTSSRSSSLGARPHRRRIPRSKPSKSSKSKGVFRLLSMSLSDTSMTWNLVPTSGGHFMVDSKAKLLTLPSETQNTSALKNEKKNEEDAVEAAAAAAGITIVGAGRMESGIHASRSNVSSSSKIDAKLNSNAVDPPNFPLSSAEMTLAMMGEVQSSIVDNERTSNVEGNDNRDGGVQNAAEQALWRIDTTNTTFRNDVRNEWVDAVFGKDFFLLKSSSDNGEQHSIDIGVKQGTGAAGVPHYVTYGAVLDRSRADVPIQQENNRARTPTATDTPSGRRSLMKKVQSTPLIFSSPSSSSLLGGGTLLASGSLASVSPSACGDIARMNSGNVGEERAMVLQTPSMLSENKPDFAKYTVDGTTPAPNTPVTQRSQFSHYSASRQQPKLGITISRIPLGLYVHSVSLESEAYVVGVSPGSVLVDINGLGMLGERSDRALERMWYYAGIFGGGKAGSGSGNGKAGNGNGGYGSGGESVGGGSENGLENNKTGSSNSSNNNSNSGPHLLMKKPVLLRLYKSGRIYSALLLGGRPLWGIHWAPCGNFALVHKVAVASIAAEAGVRRGALVVGVDREGLRTLDHGGAAGLLRERFAGGERIMLSLGYTPAASRSGYHERGDEKNPGSSGQSAVTEGPSADNGRSSNTSNSVRDVEVRHRPAEYGSAVVDTFFACTGPGVMGTVDDSGALQVSRGRSRTPTPGRGGAPLSSSLTSTANVTPNVSGVAEVAAYVASGGMLPPGGILAAAADAAAGSPRSSKADGPRPFGPCPVVESQQLLSKCWNSLSSLARSMAYAAAGSCETVYLQDGGPFERLAGGRNGRDDGEAPHSPMECVNLIGGIAGGVAQSLSPRDWADGPAAAEGVFDAHLLQLLGVAISPDMGRVEGDKRLGEMLMDIAISVALNDIALCQRLFFLLRSFISALDDQKDTRHGSRGRVIEGPPALATRTCRYAQRRLSGRMFDRSEGFTGEERHVCSEGYLINRESTGSRTGRGVWTGQDYGDLAIGASESVIEGVAGGQYPGQEPNASSRSSLDSNNPQERPQLSLLATQSSSEDAPAHGSRDNYEQSSNIESDPGGVKKKSKSKKILRMLKQPSRSMRGLKKPSDQGGSYSPDGGRGSAAPSNSKRSPRGTGRAFFPYPFNRHQSAPPATQAINVPPRAEADIVIDTGAPDTSTSLSRKFENMAWILRRLDDSCSAIEGSLMKTFSQRVADWALGSWSAGKESALASVTASFRGELRLMNSLDSRSSPSSGDVGAAAPAEPRFPVLNPVDPSEVLTGIDADECFILPSAHFPLLLCFDSEPRAGGSPKRANAPKTAASQSEQRGGGRDALYRTRVEILALDTRSSPHEAREAFVVQGAVAGVIQESGANNARGGLEGPATRRWTSGNSLVFETRSNWGRPQALSLKVSSLDADGPGQEARGVRLDVGCGFIDLCPVWDAGTDQCESGGTPPSVDLKARIYPFDSAAEFDQHGLAMESPMEGGLELHLRVTTAVVSSEQRPTKRLLLYKHGDDLRQELLAIQFVERCNQMLLASGLDLKLKTFSCQPVGSKTGFIEWVRGTVPLSELCKTNGSPQHGSIAGVDSRQSSRSKDLADGEGAAVEEVLGQQQQVLDGGAPPPLSHRWFKHQSLPGLWQRMNGLVAENPIQDFLRSAAYDEYAPYLVKKDVMAAYVKSCAGYCVITYLLGVGDRHLDNILLHQNGHLLHCDYSFILGQDPKTYLPMRITEEMIKGFGGRDSDNFAKFLFFVGAAFLALRRHGNLHSLISHVCNVVHACVGDVSVSQPPEEAILAMRGRFRLDLDEDGALAYIEDVVEKSITSKMWRAVDVMHSLGKHF